MRKAHGDPSNASHPIKTINGSAKKIAGIAKARRPIPAPCHAIISRSRKGASEREKSPGEKRQRQCLPAGVFHQCKRQQSANRRRRQRPPGGIAEQSRQQHQRKHAANHAQRGRRIAGAFADERRDGKSRRRRRGFDNRAQLCDIGGFASESR